MSGRAAYGLTAAWVGLCGLLGAATPLHAGEQRTPLRIAFHVHTSISDGHWTSRHVLEEAVRLGLDGVVVADSLVERWEFGLPPFRRLVRRVYEQPSIMTWGSANYLAHFRELSTAFPSLIIVPGVTVSPYYRWTDIPLIRGGMLEHWHRQLVVLGLTAPRDLSNLPAVSSQGGAWYRVFRDPWRLWPLALMLVGVVGWRRASWTFRGRRVLWGLVVLYGCLALLNIDLRATSPWTPYGPDPKAQPYQHLIDYVNRRGGFTVWSHPAMESQATFAGVPVVTQPYTDLLFDTQNYAGFGMNYIGYLEFLEPKNGWDALLRAFCRGARQQPAWVFGEIGWHQPSRALHMVTTDVYARERTAHGVLQAIRHGQMSAQFNLADGAGIQLRTYVVRANDRQQMAGMGDTLHTSGPVTIELQGLAPHDDGPTQIEVIRNGDVVQTVRVDAPAFAMTWTDHDAPTDKPWYYRVNIRRGTTYLFTNPTFVRGHRDVH